MLVIGSNSVLQTTGFEVLIPQFCFLVLLDVLVVF